MRFTFFKSTLWALLVVFFITLPPSTSWARQGEPPLSRQKTGSITPLDAVQVLYAPSLDAAKSIQDDEEKVQPGPLRFALPHRVNCTPSSDGTWDALPGGGQLWRCRFDCDGATDINFGFSRYALPPGATLHIYSEEHDYFQGPYTSSDNKEHNELWTPMVPGSKAVIEVYLPPGVNTQPELWLTHVNRGYRDMFKLDKRQSRQGACNNDVICPEGDPWRDQIRSVGAFTIGGVDTCSGSMVMDTAQSFTPYFLTADHCGLSSGNDSTIVVYWNFESPTCGQLGGGSLSENQSGSTWRAGDADADMALVELDDLPDPAHNVFYTGWDRSGNVPSGTVGIHHPNVDEKAISFNTDAPAIINCCIGGCNGINSHWDFNWEDGITEPGSSGSGVWDASNKLLIGYLSGGSSSCSLLDGFDCYGRFSFGWDGASASSRLKDWLDPGNTGAMTVQGSDAGASVRVNKTVYEGHDSGASCPGTSTLAVTNGTLITYCFEVTNSGNTNLNNVVLTDGLLGISTNLGSLTNKQSVTHFVETNVAGGVVNTARVVAATPSGPSITNENTAEVILKLPKPVLLTPIGGEVIQVSSLTSVTWDTNWVSSSITSVVEYTDRCSGEITTLFTDDMESGVNGWTVNHGAGSLDWFQVSDNGQSPVSSWFATNDPSITEQRLVSPAVVLPSGTTPILSFYQDVFLESGFDGGVIEISTSGTSGPWTDLGNDIIENPYNGTISTEYSNPIGGQEAFTGDNGGFTLTRVNLGSYAGQTVHIRFRLATDVDVADVGWWIDDVVIQLERIWSPVGSAASDNLSLPWNTPSAVGTDYCVRIKFASPGFADSEYCQGDAFTLTDSGPNIGISKTVYEGHDSGASCPGLDTLSALGGTPITYCFAVTNSGDETLSNVYVVDSVLGVSNNLGTMVAGQTANFSIETTLVNSLVNTARVVGTPPSDPDVFDEDTATVTLGGACDVFISEYIEGSSLNKALEIFNGTASSIDLDADDYFIQGYHNGVSSPTYSIGLTGVVAAGDAFVLVNGTAGAPLLALADQLSAGSQLNYNGDDALVLRSGGIAGTILDVFGQVGFDPGSAWTGGGVSTQDKTLRRKSTITTGDIVDSDTFDPSVEWDQFDVDNFAGLGLHTADCGGSDDDGDGLPNDWETEHCGGPTNCTPTAPTGDGDIYNYLQEYLLDYDPAESNQTFQLDGININSPVVLVFDTTNTRVYTVEFATNLVETTPSWQVLQSAVTGSNGVSAVTDTNEASARDYRIQVHTP